MDDKTIKEAVSKLQESKKRNFKQGIDLIINLKHLDLKNPDHQIELFLQLPKYKGKKTKVCALVGREMADASKAAVDTVVLQPEFDNYAQDKKAAKKLASSHDFFVAQATIMPKVATAFGRVLGPKGKMPNPKAGCVVPPNANMAQVYEKLSQTVKVSGKKAPLLQCIVGNEESKVEDIIDNVKHVYNNVVHHLPQSENNVKSVYLKYTMGKPVKVM